MEAEEAIESLKLLSVIHKNTKNNYLFVIILRLKTVQ